LAPAAGVLLGAYVKPEAGYSREDFVRELSGLERRLGRRLAIDMHFYHWSWAFPTWRETDDAAAGRIPMISWGRFSAAAIDEGAQDRSIRRRARAVARFGHPMFIRWFHEMDGGSAAADAGSPREFVTAWRRIRTIFRSEGAKNAVWVWCPNASGFSTGRAQRFYPGDHYVDWICADGYNWSPLEAGGSSGGEWRDFGDIFDDFYRWASGRGKPLMVGETGAQEGSPGRKADWINDLGRDLPMRFPGIEALVWFDAVSTSNQGGTFDWRIDSSKASLNAFRHLALTPYFHPPRPRQPVPPSGGSASGA
jgi:hypothetical protein